MPLLTPPLPSARTYQLGVSIIAAAALVTLLYFGRPFFVTLIISAMFAFILDPVVLVVMRLRLPRPAATGAVIGVALLLVYLLCVIIWAQVSTLSQDLPTYTTRVSELLDKASQKLDDMEKQAIATVVPKSLREQEQQIQQKPQEAAKARRRRAAPPVVPSPPTVQEVRIKTEPRPAITLLYGYLAPYFRALLMASFVPFLTYFMLSWRDHLRRTVLHLFRGEQRYAVGKSWESVAESTRAYLGNNILDNSTIKRHT